MWSEIVFTVFGTLLVILGFVLGKLYENRRIIGRLEALTNDMNPDVKPCCGNCWLFNGNYCTKLWNNADECYKDVYRDSHDPYDDACEDWEYDPMWTPEDYE